MVKIPTPGRYQVWMFIQGQWKVVLEKKIRADKGKNYCPGSFLHWLEIPNMRFDISVDKKINEVIFTYHNGLLIDKLIPVEGGNSWYGRIYYRCSKKPFDKFYLLPK
jgi:hypothetical protein